MTLQQLEYIVALDNERHYVTAADKCHVSQPNLTMQIRKLEDELGVQLFNRDVKPLEPTEIGAIIISKARQVLRESHSIKEYVSSDRSSVKGEFQIGIIPTLAPYLLPLFLPEFTKLHPETKLLIREMQTSDIINALDNGKLDLGLLVTPLQERSIREIPLFYEPFLLFLPLNHSLQKLTSITTKDLNAQEMLVLEEGHCFREQALAICKDRRSKIKEGFEFQSGSIEALKGLVRKGMGYTMVPELSVLEDLDQANIRRFDSPEPVREVSIAVHNSFTKESLVDGIRNSILNAIPDRFKKVEHFMRVEWR